MFLGLHLELDEIPWGVVVDVVAGVDRRSLGPVVVHGDRVGGGCVPRGGDGSVHGGAHR